MRTLLLLLGGTLLHTAAIAHPFLPPAGAATSLVRPQAAMISSFSPAAGTPGTTVTINGSGLAGTTAVSFNGIPATSFSIVSNTRLTAIVPAGATSGPIQVTADGAPVNSPTPFAVDLVVGDGSTLTSQNIPAGGYRHITVRLNATAHLTGPTQVSGLCWVQRGGSLYSDCNVLSGPGQFTLEAGASLYICNFDGIRATAAGGAIQVINRRSFSPDANYIYNGFTQQQTGDGLPDRVAVLVIDNSSSAGVSLSRTQSITGLLMLGQGQLRLGNNDLRLLSTTSRTASVSILGPGSINYDGTGRARMQRAIRVDPAFPYYGIGFRHYGSPMTQNKVQDLTVPASSATSGFTPIVNAAYNSLPTPSLPAATTPNVFGYDQSRLQAGFAGFATGWYSPASLNDPLVPGRGYSVRIQPSATVEFVGQLNQGPISTGAMDLGFGPNSGWYLLANPYPSDLDWQAVQDDVANFPAGLNGQISVYEPTSATDGFYRTYNNGIGTGGFNGMLAPMQGFFVSVAAPVAAPGLVFRDAYRSRGMSGAVFHRAAADQRPRLTLTLARPGTTQPDEAVVYFEAGASAQGLDARFDALKQPNAGQLPNLATRTTEPNAPALAINGLPMDFSGSLPLEVSVGTAGTHQLTVKGQGLPAGFVLYDQLTQTRYPLNSEETVVSFVTSGPAQLNGRFSLEAARPLGLAAAKATETLQVWPNPSTGTVRVALPTNATTLEVLDVAGRCVQRQPAAPQLTIEGLTPGLYLLRAGSAVQRLVVE